MEIGHSLGIRLILLLPAAFFIFLLLDSQDKMVRLAAVICLLVIAQLREWLLLAAKK
jgi:hypothetical protein